MVGIPALAQRPAARRRSTRAPTCGQRATTSAAGGSPGSRSRVSRPAPSGSDTATSGPSSMPGRAPASRRRCRATSRCPPTSRTSAGRRGRSAGPRPHRSAPRASTPVRRRLPRARRRRSVPRGWRRSRRRSAPRTPWSSATSHTSCTKATSAVASGVGDRPVAVRCSASRSSILCGARAAAGTWVRVDDEQVDRVRSDVEDPEAHAPQRSSWHLADWPIGWRACPSAARLRPRLGSRCPTRPTPAQRFRFDLTWLTSSLDVHLRARLPGHLRRPPRRRLLHPRARTSPTTTTSSACRPCRQARADDWQAPGERPARRTAGATALDRATRTAPARPRWSTAPASSSTGPASPPAPAARCTSWPCAPGGAAARDQARRVLAAADPPLLPHGRARRRHVATSR